MSESGQTAQNAVVVGIDGSDGSRAALDYALGEAARRGVGVRAIMAYAGPDVWSTAEGILPDARVLHDAAQKEAATLVEAAVSAYPGTAPAVTTEIYMGPASTVLIEHSKGASALVVGHRGRGGIASRLIGSVGLNAVVHADCTVIVVR